jgi:hypothetical protein
VARLSALTADSKGAISAHVARNGDLQKRCQGKPVQGAVGWRLRGRNDGDVKMDRGAAAHGHARTFDESALLARAERHGVSKAMNCEEYVNTIDPFSPRGTLRKFTCPPVALPSSAAVTLRIPNPFVLKLRQSLLAVGLKVAGVSKNSACGVNADGNWWQWGN